MLETTSRIVNGRIGAEEVRFGCLVPRSADALVTRESPTQRGSASLKNGSVVMLMTKARSVSVECPINVSQWDVPLGTRLTSARLGYARLGVSE